MEKIWRLAWRIAPLFRFVLAGLFIYAGIGKLLDISAFASQLQHFGIGNEVLAVTTAHYLPFLEITCGLALIFRQGALGAATLCLCLLTVFELGLATAWKADIRTDCGCFGKIFGSTGIRTAFLRNLGLMALFAIVWARELDFSRRKFQ